MKYNPVTGQPEIVTPSPLVWVPPDTYQLWINGELRQSWTTEIVTPPAGTPVGLLMSLTYS